MSSRNKRNNHTLKRGKGKMQVSVLNKKNLDRVQWLNERIRMKELVFKLSYG